MSIMRLLDTLPAESALAMTTFSQGEPIFKAGELADSFLIIQQGSVKQTITHAIDNESALQSIDYRLVESGQTVDAECFFSKSYRKYDTYAHSVTHARIINQPYLETISARHPQIAIALYKSIMPELMKRHSELDEQAALLAAQQAPMPLIDNVVKRAQVAQKTLSNKTDDELDVLIQAMAEAVRQDISQFAKQEAQQTGIGNIKHKQHKLGIVCRDVLQQLTGVKTIGRLTTENVHDLCEYAAPIGVLFAICPLTNPIPNSLFNSLNALKTRNALIVSYPNKAVKVGERFVDMMRKILQEHGLSPDVLQVVPQPSSRMNINKFMAHEGIDRVLATGGASLVKAAHSSGTPCLGVGPGNAPAVVHEDADLQQAAEYIFTSKSYDNGIICGSENNLIVVEPVYNAFIQALESAGATVLNAQESQQLVELCFDSQKRFQRDFIGLPADELAALAKIERTYQIKLLIVEAKEDDLWLAKEKLAPLLSLFCVMKEQALPLAQRFLEQEGAGHTASIFTNSRENIDEFAQHISVGRLLVNTPSTFGMMGVSTNLPLSFMLGSGSWGKNLTTDAVTWRDFVNIKRLAYHAFDVTIDS